MARALGLALLLLAAAPAWAADSAPPGASAAAPPGAASCSGCHNARAATVLPALQGQPPEAIVAAMDAFRTGARPATLMNRIAKGFSDEETRAIAAWVSAPH